MYEALASGVSGLPSSLGGGLPRVRSTGLSPSPARLSRYPRSLSASSRHGRVAQRVSQWAHRRPVRVLRDRASERIPDAFLHRGCRAPTLFDAATDDHHLVRVQERRGLKHVEGFLARVMIAPLEDAEPRLRDALVDPIERHVLGTIGPGLLVDVDAVDERDTDELRLSKVVSRERVHDPLRVEVRRVRAPRTAVEARVHDASGEPAVDELRGERLPRVDLRTVEGAALEARLARTNAGEVGVIEPAVAEDRLLAAREERLIAAVKCLTAEVAVLERATLGGELIERDVAEIRVADGDTTEHQDPLHD